MQRHDEILQFAEHDDVVCYTDGSVNDKFAGVGVVIVHSHPFIVERFGKSLYDVNILCAELFAIQLCLERLIKLVMEITTKNIYLFCDSKGALFCFQKIVSSTNMKDHFVIFNGQIMYINAATTLHIQQLYQSIVMKNIKLKLHWVKSHSRLAGNDRADDIAKQFRNESMINHAREMTFLPKKLSCRLYLK
jgi:ribonuclease HI